MGTAFLSHSLGPVLGAPVPFPQAGAEVQTTYALRVAHFHAAFESTSESGLPSQVGPMLGHTAIPLLK